MTKRLSFENACSRIVIPGYVSGDLRYHDARDAEASDRGIIDIGHFSSEYIIVADLADRLKGMVAECHLDASLDDLQAFRSRISHTVISPFPR